MYHPITTYTTELFNLVDVVLKNGGVGSRVMSVKLGNVVHLDVVLHSVADPLKKDHCQQPVSGLLGITVMWAYVRSPAGRYPL